MENVKKMVSSYYEGRQIQTPRHFFKTPRRFGQNVGAFLKNAWGIPLSFSLPYYIYPKVSTRARLGLLTLYFYSLNNKNETLKD